MCICMSASPCMLFVCAYVRVCVRASEEVGLRENAKEEEMGDARDGNDLARKVPRKKER